MIVDSLLREVGWCEDLIGVRQLDVREEREKKNTASAGVFILRSISTESTSIFYNLYRSIFWYFWQNYMLEEEY